MKRSFINKKIRNSIKFFTELNFLLPPFAFYSPTEWKEKFSQCQEICDIQLGWDITSFGTNNFDETGLILFTLRNGSQKNPEKYPKPYAEKIMLIQETQVTPCHFHWHKREDIINRGGGNLVIEMWQSNKSEKRTDGPFNVNIDGIQHHFDTNAKIILHPGQSICLTPYLAHRFYAQSSFGPVMAGEVSTVNDDTTDNCFIDGQPRFDPIIEDEEIKYMLATDLLKMKKI
ncbi:MAG: D-lyxose/D-mannose family sugar isomerase [Lentisphaeria bacterium]